MDKKFTDQKNPSKRLRLSKISEEKVYQYLRMVETEGVTRRAAYAECIDPTIYDTTSINADARIEYFQKVYPGYQQIKEMVLAEKQDWAARNSVRIQKKSVELLGNLIDRANAIASDPNSDAKDLNVAVQTLKSIMPAFQAIGTNANKPEDLNPVDRKTRAKAFIN